VSSNRDPVPSNESVRGSTPRSAWTHFAPAQGPVPRTANRFFIFSEKAQRRITLFGIPALYVWLKLELDHCVTQLCERPIVIPSSRPVRMVDFWVAGSEGESYLIIDRSRREEGPACAAVQLYPALVQWAESRSARVDLVSPGEIRDAERTAAANWIFILQHCAAFRDLATSSLCEEIRRRVDAPKAIRDVVVELSAYDSSAVLAALFLEVRRGSISVARFNELRIHDASLVQPC
jgi:hypothetical protein